MPEEGNPCSSGFITSQAFISLSSLVTRQQMGDHPCISLKRTTPLLPGREIEEEEKRGKRRKINEGRENECSGGSGGAMDI